MTTGEIRPGVKKEEKDWKFGEIERALSAFFKPHEDKKIGSGVYCKFGDKGREKFLAIYPEKSAVRVLNDNMQFFLQEVGSPFVTDRTVRFDGFDKNDSYTLRIMRNGDVKSYIGGTPFRHKENKKPEIELSGKVVEDPTNPIREGIKVVKFPLALIDGYGENELQTVIISGRSLEEIMLILKKGKFVTVTGFFKEREGTDRWGNAKTYKDFNANRISILL